MTSLLPRTPDGVARIAFSGTVEGEPWANIFHVKFDVFAAATIAELGTFLGSMAGSWNTNLMPWLSAGVTMNHSEATLFLAAPDVLKAQLTHAYVGGTGTDGESVSAAYVLSWLISASYRGGKPRTYVPGVTEARTSAHREVTPAAANGIQASAHIFMTDTNGAGGADLTNPKLGTVSYRVNNAPRVAAIFRPYLDVTVHPRLGTQRRRYGKWRP